MTGNQSSSLDHTQCHSNHLDAPIAPLPGIPNSFRFYVRAYIDSTNATWFADHIIPVLRRKPAAVLFDPSAMTHTRHVGHGTFVQLLQTVREYGGALTVCCVQARVREVFTLLGFSAFFDLDSFYQDAVESLARSYVGERPQR